MADGYSFSCNWKEGFVPDATKQGKYGYILAMNACGINATTNASYHTKTFCNYPFADGATYLHPKVGTGFGGSLGKLEGAEGIGTMECVGVIESYSWSGSTADPICVSAYISSEYAKDIKAAQKTSFQHTRVDQLSWWMFDYDPEKKVWYECAYPKGTTTSNTLGEIKGQVNKNGDDVVLNIATDGVKVHPNLESMVYNIYFEVVPATDDLYTIGFGLAKEKQFIKPWGVKVGATAASTFSG